MKCPSCGFNNMPGSDECGSCHEDLASLDGVVPRTKIEKILMSDPIKRLSPREAIFILASASVLDAVRAMNQSKMGCILVGSADRLVGILTERDVVLKGICLGKDLGKTAVADLMTPDPERLTDGDTLAYAVNRMSVGGYRHLPIERAHRTTGIISVRDVLNYLSKSFP
ncbi:MAG TPA: CBS domain-containing protein [bacterium]|nr:CBS domain-containing protein [bacterium]